MVGEVAEPADVLQLVTAAAGNIRVALANAERDAGREVVGGVGIDAQGEVDVVAAGLRCTIVGVEALPRVIDVDERAGLAAVAVHQHLVADGAGLRGAGRECRLTEQRNLLRCLQDGHHVLAEQRVRGGGWMHPVGKHIALIRTRCIGVRQARTLWSAAHRAGARAASRRGGIGETVGLRIGDHLGQQTVGVDRDDAFAQLAQAGVELAVEDQAEPGQCRGAGGALCCGIGSQADVWQVEHQDVLGASGLQLADQLHFLLCRECHIGLCLRRGFQSATGQRGMVEDVVGAAPDGIQRMLIGAAGAQIGIHLSGQRGHATRRAGRVVVHSGATPRVVTSPIE